LVHHHISAAIFFIPLTGSCHKLRRFPHSPSWHFPALKSEYIGQKSSIKAASTTIPIPIPIPIHFPYNQKKNTQSIQNVMVCTVL
jgi:hypothetical protein